MPEEKNYSSFTGLTDFYYGTTKSDDTGINEAQAERIKFLQNINISTPQDIVKAFGDNGIAEMAMSTDATQLTTQFHKLPIEDRVIIYGWETANGMHGLSNDPNPPYISCMFTKTMEGGSTEHIGFTKGKFKMADVEGQTKGESLEFGNDSTEGEFMARPVEGFDKDMTFIIVADEPGETENRNKLYKAIFGVEHPDAVETP
ncbi:major tail protein [Pseudogracilibacillus auburnensis]|uniref:major tail protein n=1 Tax=Pseudogracilibacillus auburnensis TaxID=1494959 RepID=UPI001A96424E|nr:major tail protein [Pseudogracilibacillus auburnensis]MBO1005606.1 phage tail protein [Pseudogracilibacillus auburnensis]